jgi:hypothetical protein
MIHLSSPIHFLDSLSWAKASLWPGSPAWGGIARKKHRREKNFAQSSFYASAEWGGLSGAPTSE